MINALNPLHLQVIIMADIIPFDHKGSGVVEMPAHLVALFGGDDAGNIAPRATLNQLSYRGKTWRRVVDGEEIVITKTDKDTGDVVPVQIVSLVILDHNRARSRAFYEGNFEEGKNQMPRCASADGKVPDAGIKDPICATCAACPNAVKGSKITENGKQTTACATTKRIAVVPPGVIDKHPPLLLRLAQTSVWDKDNKEEEAKGWYAYDQFVDMLRARGAQHTAAVVTRVKFDPKVAYPKLLFSASQWLSVEDAAKVRAKLDTESDEIGKLLNGIGSDGVAGQPAAAGAATPAASAPAQPAGPTAEEVAAQAAAAAAVAEAERKAAAKAKRVAAAEAAAAAAAAAAKAAAEAEDDEGGGDWGGDTATAAATPAAAATKPAAAATPDVKPSAAQTAAGAGAAATVVAGTPAALSSLLGEWDD